MSNALGLIGVRWEVFSLRNGSFPVRCVCVGLADWVSTGYGLHDWECAGLKNIRIFGVMSVVRNDFPLSFLEIHLWGFFWYGAIHCIHHQVVNRAEHRSLPLPQQLDLSSFHHVFPFSHQGPSCCVAVPVEPSPGSRPACPRQGCPRLICPRLVYPSLRSEALMLHAGIPYAHTRAPRQPFSDFQPHYPL